jgi:hypothetical protein
MNPLPAGTEVYRLASIKDSGVDRLTKLLQASRRRDEVKAAEGPPCIYSKGERECRKRECHVKRWQLALSLFAISYCCEKTYAMKRSESSRVPRVLVYYNTTVSGLSYLSAGTDVAAGQLLQCCLSGPDDVWLNIL